MFCVVIQNSSSAIFAGYIENMAVKMHRVNHLIDSLTDVNICYICSLTHFMLLVLHI